MAIPAMALLQQHDARRDILTEPAARRRAVIEARGHSELGAFGTGGVRNWGRNRAVKTNWLVRLSVYLSVRLSHACFVSNPKNLPAIFLYHMKGQSF